MDDLKKEEFRKEIVKIYRKSKMIFRPEEFNNMEITDFGLGDFKSIGIGVIIYINTERVCSKEVALLPYQICPQHRHPNKRKVLGKEETFRCRWGKVYLYLEGPVTKDIKAKIPEKYKDKFTVFYEIVLKPGDQYKIDPATDHWFQAGPEGAVLSEFSSHSDDATDIFFDKNIERKIVDNLEIYRTVSK